LMGPRYPGYESDPLRQADSPMVQPLTHGMTDAEWVAWAQVRQQFAAVPAAEADAPPAAPKAKGAALAPVDLGPEVNKAEGSITPPADANAVYYVPGEWNYYGDMGLTFIDAVVRSVVTGPNTVVTDPAAQSVIGAQVSFNNRPDDTGRSTGMLVDVNAEDVPSSQVLADAVMIAQKGTALLAGTPSKAVTRNINFQRNFNLGGPNGAGCLFQCVIPLSSLGSSPLVQQFPAQQDGAALTGVVFHYYMYRPLQEINTFKYPFDPGKPDSPWFAQIEARYRQAAHAPGGVPTPGMTPREVEALFAANGLNPDYVQVVGTFAPAYGGEVASAPVGRSLVPSGRIPAKGTRGNAGGDNPTFQLAPAVVNVDYPSGTISADFSGTFPDSLQGTDYDPLDTSNNPKWVFGTGPATLYLVQGTDKHRIGDVDYRDTDAGDRVGWIFDFPIGGLSRDVLDNGTLELWAPVKQTDGTVKDVQLLLEQDYLVVSDQAAIFGEQAAAPQTRFISDDGNAGPVRIRVFRKGVELTADTCPAVTVWEYDTTPNQATGPLTLVSSTFGPGQDLTVDTGKNGNRLYTFTVQGQAPPPGFTGMRTNADGSDTDTLYPPLQYGKLPLAYASMINLRILPNDVDYTQYYVPGTSPPVGNERLTFDVVYAQVLRNYYLLYPAMSKRVPLNDPSYWEDPEMAMRLFQRTQLSWWGRSEYMPRTRDLSDSRRALLQAWTLKYFQLPGAAPAPAAVAPGAPDPSVPA
ncbi:MAG TPA: hypothetical protein VF142_20400, partial [Longimicrobium sp.]